MADGPRIRTGDQGAVGDAERARLDGAEAAAYLEQSVLASIGRAVQPAFALAGFDEGQELRPKPLASREPRLLQLRSPTTVCKPCSRLPKSCSSAELATASAIS